MKKNKTVFIEKEELHSVVCNMCGHEIQKNTHGYLCEHLSLEKNWGYGSPYDGDKHCIDICSHCYENLLDMLKIPPTK